MIHWMTLVWLVTAVGMRWRSAEETRRVGVGDDAAVEFAAVGTTGVTSLCPTTTGTRTGLVVGTKRGGLYSVRLQDMKGNDNGAQVPLQDLNFRNDDDDHDHAKQNGASAARRPTIPFPIYSLATDDAQTTLFCGGGDRYVTVWEKQTKTHGWSKVQRLGPHTGWVKDVVYDKHHQVLHSIGCNCIETWKHQETDSETDNDNQQPWYLWKHSSIESSVSAGSTLSSDLLCLCLVAEMALPGYFVAGGVDGRIHLWGAGEAKPVSSVTAHAGRVNSLAAAPKARLLFSGSHDGTVKCWYMKGCADIALPAAASATLDAGGGARITTLTCVNDCLNSTQICFGTQNGLVGLASAGRVSNGGVEFSLLQTLQLDGGPTIHALAMLPPRQDESASTSTTLAVGHSLGMAFIDIEISQSS